ncbi:hypothetical protein chiPu_0006631 [Chiloscyllium punctatum]|uniref:HTH CENPB-type domain-containing protein n=1 Tax=Chiloscyllium punctatum TaxID=137246 RepID=A0A401SCX5_CHIPU|nr:hypothetical protein [Chiloscyllium punctatum]
MSVKRKHTTVTIEQKSEILQHLDRGKKASRIAQEYNTGIATVSDIKKARPAIEKLISLSDTANALKRKSMKPAKDEQLDQAVFLWFSQQREKGIPVSGLKILEKAASFHERLHTENRKRLPSYLCRSASSFRSILPGMGLPTPCHTHSSLISRDHPQRCLTTDSKTTDFSRTITDRGRRVQRPKTVPSRLRNKVVEALLPELEEPNHHDLLLELQDYRLNQK